ncbi:carbohydrate ABC transporter permease [Actinoplanes sp. NBRC 101535]|uniref:carbohydrate ABC transporter permease n=1 Tax=Actinoplanes sp. NBRC 101535 TaxID=3032196 RepID=UPI0024A117F7|nr:carbohydrate ABC transporter permease [Actinoplanes sp. NBRC 101535]GLY06410.1 sugar ABC transporter permease [Actinoplanes sp. NBRC 101535]
MTTVTAAVPVTRRVRKVLLHLAMIAAICALLYPVAWLISSSFKPASEILSGASLWPSRIVLSNYTEVFAGVAGVGVWRFAVNSLLISAGAVVGNVVSCSLAAYAFAWMRFRLRGPMFAFMIGTIMLPVHVLLIPQYTIFQNLGMIDTIWPLVLPKLLATDAFFIFMIVQFMRGLPSELGDAARIDGCGPLRAFRYVVLPLSKPALVTTAIFTFIWSWNDFLSQLIYLNSPETYTMPLALRLFIDQTGESSYGAMMAMSVLTLLPIALFFVAFQRLLVQGVTTTGMKG